MTNIVHYDFSKSRSNSLFSADIYSHDMKKYQFEISTGSLLHAYSLFIAEAKKIGVHFVRCIAVYQGKVKTRIDCPEPIKVWQQGWCMTGLKEF